MIHKLSAKFRFERPFLGVGILLAALLGSGFIWMWPTMPQHMDEKREFRISLWIPQGPACFGDDEEEYDQWLEMEEKMTKEVR